MTLMEEVGYQTGPYFPLDMLHHTKGKVGKVAMPKQLEYLSLFILPQQFTIRYQSFLLESQEAGRLLNRQSDVRALALPLQEHRYHLQALSAVKPLRYRISASVKIEVTEDATARTDIPPSPPCGEFICISGGQRGPKFKANRYRIRPAVAFQARNQPKVGL